MNKKTNKPVLLTVLSVGDDGEPKRRESFHKTESAAHERIADILRRDDTFLSYEITRLSHG